MIVGKERILLLKTSESKAFNKNKKTMIDIPIIILNFLLKLFFNLLK